MAAEVRSNFRPDLDIFGVNRNDPGWLYVIKFGPSFKIGKTTNPKQRLRSAKTWLPSYEIVGIKPFWDISHLERQLLISLAQLWIHGEWHIIPGNNYSSILETFSEFYEDDRDMNSVDFIYWMHDFGEILMEYNKQNISLRKWQKESTFS